MALLGLIVKGAFRNRRRSISTLASITVSFLLLTILVATWYSFYTVSGAGYSAYRLVTTNRVSQFFPVQESCRSKIRSMPGVAATAQLNWWVSKYKEGGEANKFVQYGTDPAEIFNVYNDWKVPAEQLAAFQHDPSGAAVPQKLAQRYGWKLGDRILLKGTMVPIDLDLHVRAIYDPAGSGIEALLFNWTPVQDQFPRFRGIQGNFMTRVKSPELVSVVAKKIDEENKNSPLPTKSETESSFQLGYIAMLGNLKLFIFGIAAATIFAMLLVCANTAAMSVRERIKEIAVMRTMGYPMRTVLAMLLGESAILALLGCLLGIPMGIAAARLTAAKIPAARLLENVHFDAVSVLMIVGLALLIALGSSLLSALRGSRGLIINGLKHVA